MINNVVVVLECDLMLLASRWDITSCPSDLTVIKKALVSNPLRGFLLGYSRRVDFVFA
jgi:hypothetical protein